MRDSGGDWGVIEQGHFGEEMAEVEKAAFALEPGQFSDVLHTRFGYHLVYVSAKQAAHVQSEREAYDDVYRRVAESKSAAVYEPYMNSLRRSTAIEIFDPELMDAKPSIRPGKKMEDFMSKPAPKKEEAETKEETGEKAAEITETKEETTPVLKEETSGSLEEASETKPQEKAEEEEKIEPVKVLEETEEKAEEDPLKDLDAQLDSSAADPDLPGAKPVSETPIFEMKEVK